MVQNGKGPYFSLMSCQPPKKAPVQSFCANLVSGQQGWSHIVTNHQEPSSHIVRFPSDTFGGQLAESDFLNDNSGHHYCLAVSYQAGHFTYVLSHLFLMTTVAKS